MVHFCFIVFIVHSYAFYACSVTEVKLTVSATKMSSFRPYNDR